MEKIGVFRNSVNDAAAAAIQARYGGVCVLKGAGSLIAAGDGPPAAKMWITRLAFSWSASR